MIDTNTDAIRAGLESGEFFLEYLPTIDLASGNCVGAEALTRWRRGSAVVHPFNCVALIKDIPLSGQITGWVIETIAQELKGWLREHRHAHISINLPPEIIGRGGIAHALTRTGLMGVRKQLIGEITEHGVPDALGVDTINRGRAMGIRIALDDVGLTNSNMMVLSRVNVDIIKIPKSFVDSLDKPEAHTRLKNLQTVLKTANIQVIVEGVETARQLELLKEAGVTMAQGWYFSHSLPVRAFKTFFHTHQSYYEEISSK